MYAIRSGVFPFKLPGPRNAPVFGVFAILHPMQGRSAERKSFFLVWLLVFALTVGWFVWSNNLSDEEVVRSRAVGALQDIAAYNPKGICDKLSPGLIRNIQSMQFQELPQIPIQLPEAVFCVQAAKAVFDLYGDYYVTPSSFRRMASARVVVEGNRAKVYFQDGEYSNVSIWVKRNDTWVIDDGILGLVQNVARPRKPAQPRQIQSGYTS